MSDRRLRELERAVVEDRSKWVELRRERYRLGLCVWCGHRARPTDSLCVHNCRYVEQLALLRNFEATLADYRVGEWPPIDPIGLFPDGFEGLRRHKAAGLTPLRAVWLELDAIRSGVL